MDNIQNLLGKESVPNFIKYIEGVNEGITYQNFVKGVNSGKMGFKMVNGESNILLKSGSTEKLTFSIFVMLYTHAPLIIVPIISIINKNWILLFGILFVYLFTYFAIWRNKSIGGWKGNIIYWFTCLMFGWWVSGGFHFFEPITFFFFCAVWGDIMFTTADKLQDYYALNVLIKNETIFNKAIELSIILIVKKTEAKTSETSSNQTIINNNNFNSNKATDLINKGKEKIEVKDYNSAIEYFNQALEINPKGIDAAKALMERGKTKYSLNDIKGGEQDLFTAKDLLDKIESSSDLYNQAIVLHDSGNYENAIKLFNKAITFNSELTDIYFDRGFSKEKLNDIDGAIEDYTKSINCNAFNVEDAYKFRGYLRQYRLKDYEGAISDYSKCLELIPDDIHKGFIYYHRSKLLDDFKALQELKKAEKIGYGNDNPNLYFEFYQRNLSIDDNEGAINALNKYIDKNPQSGKITISYAYQLKGFLKIVNNDFKLAMLDFDKSIELNKENPESYYWRGTAKNKMGNFEDGNIDIQIAKQLGYIED